MNKLGRVIKENVNDYPHLNINDSKNATGFPEDLNKDQFKKFIAFKKECIGQNLLINFDYFDDYYLLKFCRARKFDVEKVVIMFKNFLKWRKESHVDDIDRVFKFTEKMDVKRLYPHGYHKVDKKGRPIYIELISQVKLKELFKVISVERLTDYYIQEYEHLMKMRFPACSKQMGKRIDQSFTILDVKGVGVTDLFGETKKFLEIAMSLGQDYYPENMGVMFIVNAGGFFGFIWSFVKKFLDPKTAEKIQVKGSEYKEKLLKYVDEDNLPDFFGGRCKCSHIKGGCLFSDIGPWNPKGGLDEE